MTPQEAKTRRERLSLSLREFYEGYVGITNPVGWRYENGQAAVSQETADRIESTLDRLESERRELRRFVKVGAAVVRLVEQTEAAK